MRIVQKLSRCFLIFSLVLSALTAFGGSAEAQTTTVDPTFNTIPDKDLTAPVNFVIQPDNKIIVFGGFQIINGTIKSQIARLNTDGSLDNSFNFSVTNFIPTNVLLQPDGKILVSGSINNFLQAVVYRLNPDGTQDSSFTSPFAPLPPPGAITSSNAAQINAIQPDGKILVTLVGSTSGTSFYNLYRLNTDGTFDSTFTVASVGGGRLVRTTPQKIDLLPDGKILVATNTTSGGGTSGNLQRFNQNGTLDSTFESPTILGTGGTPNGFPRSLIYDFDIQTDGSFIFVGDFISVNAVGRQNAAKILPAGNVDPAFNGNIASGSNRIEILPDGRVLIGNATRINRLAADGSLDNSFTTPANITQIYQWKIDAAGRIVLYASFVGVASNFDAFVRINQNGVTENLFVPKFGIASSITAIGAQPDGKVVFAGDFIRVNGVPRTSIARVNADGSLDATFNAGIGLNSNFSGTISKILIQSDGKLLIVGNFTSFNGTARSAIVRLNSDGSLDGTFNPGFSSATIEAVAALQADGKILVGGSFTSVDGNARTGIARFNPDGSLDASFNPTFGNPFIRSITVQTDGKILVGGSFSGVNGFSRTGIVRLNADGSLDSAFNAGNIFGVGQIEIQADGKYLISTGSLVRLNNNGTTDTTFVSPTFSSPSSNAPPLQFLAQPDGSILVGGSFSAVNNVPRSNIVRLRPTGAVDTGFFPTGANNAIRTIVRQANGQILVGGDFSIIGGAARISIARLNVAAYRLVTPFDYDGDGRADVAVFRPANGNWYVLPSQSGNFYGFPFGQAGDQIAPADYDADGKTDIAVFRETVPGAAGKAYFYILNSADNSFRPVQFGSQGDVPVPGDWDGDGKGDLAVYRAATTAGGQSYFYYRPSSQPNVDYVTLPLGTQSDRPIPADYDGDGRLDPAIFQAGGGGIGVWRILYSSLNQVAQTFFGLSNDIPTPVDFDGDGKANLAVFRPSNGTWYTSQNSQNNFGAIQFGANGDLPIAADYDGDGRADTAVFRPATGSWYLNRTTSGFTGVQFGASGDKPAPNAFIR